MSQLYYLFMIIDGSDKAMMIDCKGSDRQELPYTVVAWIRGLDSKIITA